ncbi:MAG: 4Fe-4S cluster-binding domain-containing protein [Paludibacteraceae bacterium]|nr:4Fe-4S cluster-binding domain-containing protein [Paludibacteraceae bacterium]
MIETTKYYIPRWWSCAPVSAISRFRINVDGSGVNTLVTFYGCPLDCKYCLNANMKKVPASAKMMSTMNLYEIVKKDNIYFRATGGGITFGGGEPLLQYKFIKEFKEHFVQNWKIRVETCLNVPKECMVALYDVVDEWIVDVKTMQCFSYYDYTGSKDFRNLVNNLKALIAAVGPEKILVRVPLIEFYSNEQDQEYSVGVLKKMGFTRFDLFTYKTVYNE